MLHDIATLIVNMREHGDEASFDIHTILAIIIISIQYDKNLYYSHVQNLIYYYSTGIILCKNNLQNGCATFSVNMHSCMNSSCALGNACVVNYIGMFVILCQLK